MKFRNKDLIIAAAAAVLSLLFHLSYFRYGVQNLVDLGVACVDSERILEGQVPGRDFFDPYGPGRFYLIALTFLIAGKSLLSLSVLCVILLAVKDGLVYLFSRCLLSRPWALFVTALAVMVHGPMHKVFLMLAGGLVILAAFRAVLRPGKASALFLGLSVVAAGLLRYDMGAAGLIITVSLLALLAGSRRLDLPELFRFSLYFGLGAAMLALPVGAYFILEGVDFGAMVKHHAIRLYSLEEANADKTGLWELHLSRDPAERHFGYLLLALAAALLWAFGYGLVLWWKEKRDRTRPVLIFLLILMSLMLFNQVRLGVRFSRLSQVAPPLFILFALLLQWAFRVIENSGSMRKLRWISPLTGAVLFFLLAAYIWSYQGYASQDSFAVLHPKYKKYYMDHPRSRCYFKGNKGRIIHEVTRYLENVTEEGEPIYTGPTCPLFHFLTNRPNPTPFTDFTFYYFSEENQRLVIRYLEKDKVNYIVNWERILTGFSFESCAPVLAEYFKFNFAKERPFRFMSSEGSMGQSFTILRRVR